MYKVLQWNKPIQFTVQYLELSHSIYTKSTHSPHRTTLTHGISTVITCLTVFLTQVLSQSWYVSTVTLNNSLAVMAVWNKNNVTIKSINKYKVLRLDEHVKEDQSVPFIVTERLSRCLARAFVLALKAAALYIVCKWNKHILPTRYIGIKHTFSHKCFGLPIVWI